MNEKRIDMGKAIVEFEGRFDKAGNLLVYKLPAGDGGGAYEVAGINERYHPSKAKQLKDLIEAGQHQKAMREASEYIEAYTRPVRKFFPSEELADQNSTIEFVLRDSAFNRGNKGAAAILQIALVVPIDGAIGSNSKAAFAAALSQQGQANVLRRITVARETYERNTYPWKTGKRDESSKFWAGLSNRWAKAHKTAQTRFA
jgi:lysozyme family protein